MSMADWRVAIAAVAMVAAQTAAPPTIKTTIRMSVAKIDTPVLRSRARWATSGPCCRSC
jgi:hypothetical protein